jgi:hypothetical protein
VVKKSTGNVFGFFSQEDMIKRMFFADVLVLSVTNSNDFIKMYRALF